MTGLRAEKRLQTSRLLAETSFRLAVERGLDGFVIDDVTTATGYSRRTFANHFSCKEEAVAEVVVLTISGGLDDLRIDPERGSLIDALEQALRSQLNDETVERFAQLVALAYDYPTLQPYILATNSTLMGIVLDAVSRARGGIPADLDTLLLLGAIQGMFGTLTGGEIGLLQHIEDGAHRDAPALSLEEVVDAVFAKLRSGF